MDLTFTQTLQVICIILNELLLNGILSIKEVYLTMQKTFYGVFCWLLELFESCVCKSHQREPHRNQEHQYKALREELSCCVTSLNRLGGSCVHIE